MSKSKTNQKTKIDAMMRRAGLYNYVHSLADKLREDFGRMSAIERALFGITLAMNLYGPMDHGEFMEIRDLCSTPCGEQDCTCHIQGGALMDAIESLRDRWISHKKELECKP